MLILELILCFFIGFLLLTLASLLFDISEGLLFKVLLSSIVGGLSMCVLLAIGFSVMPIGTITAFITGFLGLPGLFVLFLLNVIL